DRGEDDLHSEEEEQRPEDDHPYLGQGSEPARLPAPEDPDVSAETGQADESSGNQTRLEFRSSEHPLERPVVAREPLRIAEHASEQPDREDLDTEQGEDHAEEHGVDVDDGAADAARAGKE